MTANSFSLFYAAKGVLALVEGLQCNRGLLVLDLEFKSIASAEGLDTLLKAHPTLEVSTVNGGQRRGQGGSHRGFRV